MICTEDKCTEGKDTKLLNLFFCRSFLLLRMLENSLLSAEVKEGEILPPTIQKLMKGYNKYLRPFFDSKGNCTHPWKMR